jgi:hypothetical protein
VRLDLDVAVVAAVVAIVVFIVIAVAALDLGALEAVRQLLLLVGLVLLPDDVENSAGDIAMTAQKCNRKDGVTVAVVNRRRERLLIVAPQPERVRLDGLEVAVPSGLEPGKGEREKKSVMTCCGPTEFDIDQTHILWYASVRASLRSLSPLKVNLNLYGVVLLLPYVCGPGT